MLKVTAVATATLPVALASLFSSWAAFAASTETLSARPTTTAASGAARASGTTASSGAASAAGATNASGATAATASSGATVATTSAARDGNDYALTAKLLVTPARLEINSSGLSEFDKSAWSIEKQDDGTELYTFKKKPEARAAVMRAGDGTLESITTYKTAGKTETAASMTFEKGVARSFTSCEDAGGKDFGRVCVTATRELCGALKAGTLQAEQLKETDTAEMRALAILLTLRGADHQLDNMVRSGNRLGLKTALQTTKGQILAMAKEVAIEQHLTSRAPAGTKASVDEALAQTVLEKSLPRLKQACTDTHFN